MKYTTVPVNNVRRLQAAMDALAHRAPSLPGLAVLRGVPGYGKSTAAAYVGVNFKAIYVRALAVWSAGAMLDALMVELGLVRPGEAPARNKSRKMGEIIAALDDEPRPIIVDEADYVMGDKQMAETLRDLHDMCGVAIILIGMDKLMGAIKSRPQISSRVAHDVQFEALDLTDAKMVAKSLCEVPVADDLVAHLHSAAGGNIRNIVNGLAHIEALGRSLNLKTVSRADWADRKLFFSHKQPAAQRPALVAPAA